MSCEDVRCVTHILGTNPSELDGFMRLGGKVRMKNHLECALFEVLKDTDEMFIDFREMDKMFKLYKKLFN